MRRVRVALVLLAALSIGATNVTWEYLGKFTVTAYCPCQKCCGRFADGHTADGTKLTPRSRVVAAPRGIAFNTMLYIPGYGSARVADRGGAIKGRKLDVFFWTHQRAMRWGVKKVAVWRRRTPD